MHRDAPPLRILMVLESNFTKRGGGGAESQLRTVALALKRAGQRVVIMTPLSADGPQATAERCYGLAVARVKYPRWKLVGAGIMNLRFAAFLVANRHRYDAWHVHIGHNMGALTCLIGDIVGKPVVVKISGWWELEAGLLAPDRGVFGRVARGWLKRATVVQAISTRVAAELEKNGFPRERVVVLPNAVDTERFTARTAVREPGEPFVAVYVGRLVPEKDLATLVRGWAQAFPGRTDVRLRLVGGGPLERELRALAERLGAAAQVELLGHRDDVEAVLAEAHVGVLPSRIEGLSNTLLEFMACGLPAIASRVSGSEDFVVPGRNGWLHDVGDVAAVAAALREAEAMPPARLAELGRNARADVEAQAAVPRVIGRLMELYRGQRP
jgi:L-malate glycosyltransferase